jgi:aminomethyltransferase
LGASAPSRYIARVIQDSLRETPLIEHHRRAGARLVEFAGWRMPVQYTGVMEEHQAVRQHAGLFDVSHMGEILIRGAAAESFVQWLTPNDVSRLAPGRAHYSGLLTEKGTYIDDFLVYRMAPEELMLVVNAANRERVYRWILSHCPAEVEVVDASDEFSLLALQGPRAAAILQPLTPLDLRSLRYYGFADSEVAGRRCLVSRTGYTGEDGFELYLAPDDAPPAWEVLLEEGAGAGLAPAGLGARDTLRLEAGMALYGHELDEETTPFHAGLQWVVKLSKGEFIGREALVRLEREGVDRRLVGFEVSGRGIARQGHPVLGDGEPVGTVTSGTWSPTFGKALGMAYVTTSQAQPGAELAAEVRGRLLPIRLVELPFYRRPKTDSDH